MAGLLINWFLIVSNQCNMKAIKYLLIIIFISNLTSLFAKEISISGTAKGYEGKTIHVNLFEEFFMYKTKTIASSKVSDDGSFDFKINLEKTRKGTLQIEENIGLIYLSPNTEKYSIIFPEVATSKRALRKKEIILGFNNLNQNDINHLILEYNIKLDKLLYNDSLREFSYMKDTNFIYKLDTFNLHIKNYFNEIKDAYLYNYIRYSINSLKQLSDHSHTFKNQFLTYKEELESDHILYENDMYMEFFQQFYGSTYQSFDREKRRELNAYINGGDFKACMSILNTKFLVREDIRELVLMKIMAENYTKDDFLKKGLLTNYLYIIKNSKHTENQNIAKLYFDELTKMEVGYPAPKFSLTNTNNDTINLSDFKGKYVYINFFSTWCTECVSEMKVIKELQEKYKKSVVFISISLDKDVEEFAYLQKRYPIFDWNILHFNYDYNLLDQYKVNSVPHYVLLDRDGNVVQSFANRPVPLRDHPSIDYTLHNLVIKNQKKKEFSVGVK